MGRITGKHGINGIDGKPLTHVPFGICIAEGGGNIWRVAIDKDGGIQKIVHFNIGPADGKETNKELFMAEFMAEAKGAEWWKEKNSLSDDLKHFDSITKLYTQFLFKIEKLSTETSKAYKVVRFEYDFATKDLCVKRMYLEKGTIVWKSEEGHPVGR